MLKKHAVLICALAFTIGCGHVKGLSNQYLKGNTKGLSVTDIANGLKEALKVGTEKSVKVLHSPDGFLKDQTVKILFPPEAQKVAKKLRQLGMGGLVDKLIVKLNRGAERAVKRAIPIFVKAITSMTFEDAKKILNGPDNAATEYFKQKTTDALYKAFAPEIRSALDKVGAAAAWSAVTSAYNRIPFVKRVDTDIVRYATTRALAGLFVKVQIQEKKIRNHPAARVTKLLQKVFGSIKR